MTIDALGILRDVLVIAYLFILRIGVPILITFMLGAWLQKVLREPESAPQPMRGEAACAEPDEAGATHCWDVKHCPENLRAQCVAAQRPDLPCWLALQVGGEGLRQTCYTCPLFTTVGQQTVPVAAQRIIKPVERGG